MKTFLLIASIIVALASAALGAQQVYIARQPGAIVPLSLWGVPLSAYVFAVVSGAAVTFTAWHFRSTVAKALDTLPPKYQLNDELTQAIDGPGFSIQIVVDATRLGDAKFAEAVVKAVQAGLGIVEPETNE